VGVTDLLVKWASRSRPDLLAAHFPKWDVPGVRFIVSLDMDDEKLPAYYAFLNGRPNVRIVAGKSSCKVEAINRDLEGETADILVCGSDDMVPRSPAWADRIKALMAQHWPDGDGVLHLDDGRVGGTLNTLSVMGWKYFKRFDFIYYGLPKYADGYASLWPDNEFMEVSRKLGRSVYVDEVLIAHEWIGAHAPHDALHRRNEKHYHDDAKTFRRRQLQGFPVTTSQQSEPTATAAF
jgi:hypothetical protein